MPKQELTEEQKQVKHISKRWKQSLWCFLFICAVAHAIAMKITDPNQNVSPGMWLLICSLVFGVFASGRYDYLANKRLVQNFISEEIHALEQVAAQENSSQRMLTREARRLLGLHKSVTAKPETELLRASKATDDGTLLRPTASTPETPKEELLRASEEKP